LHGGRTIVGRNREGEAMELLDHGRNLARKKGKNLTKKRGSGCFSEVITKEKGETAGMFLSGKNHGNARTRGEVKIERILPEGLRRLGRVKEKERKVTGGGHELSRGQFGEPIGEWGHTGFV